MQALQLLAAMNHCNHNMFANPYMYMRTHHDTYYSGADVVADGYSMLTAASDVVVPLQVKVQIKRKGPFSSNLCCHLRALHFSEALFWDLQQLMRRS